MELPVFENIEQEAQVLGEVVIPGANPQANQQFEEEKDPTE